MLEILLPLALVAIAIMAIAPFINKAPAWVRLLIAIPAAAYFFIDAVRAEETRDQAWGILVAAFIVVTVGIEAMREHRQRQRGGRVGPHE